MVSRLSEVCYAAQVVCWIFIMTLSRIFFATQLVAAESIQPVPCWVDSAFWT